MRRPFLYVVVPAIAFTLVCILDIVRESPPWDMVDIALDVAQTAMLVLLVVAVAWSMQRVSDLREDQQAFRDAIVRNNAQGDDWRAARAAEIAAMSEAIALEFRAWGLTGEEMDVAELLLKGASMKEIALDQSTSLATIRQRAKSLYRKAGITGRVELSAYFLDSLFAEMER